MHHRSERWAEKVIWHNWDEKRATEQIKHFKPNKVGLSPWQRAKVICAFMPNYVLLRQMFLFCITVCTCNVMCFYAWRWCLEKRFTNKVLLLLSSDRRIHSLPVWSEITTHTPEHSLRISVWGWQNKSQGAYHTPKMQSHYLFYSEESFFLNCPPQSNYL